MATTAGTKKATAKSETEIIETSGEVLADGPVELVAPNGSRPQLLFWPDKRRPIVASEIIHDGRRFIPVNLHPTFWARTKLPTGVVERGSPSQLLAEITAVLRDFVGLTADVALLIAGWVVTTWFSDVVSTPLTLLPYGTEMAVAVRLFRVLHCLCRHPLLLGEVTRGALSPLMKLQPTLLLLLNTLSIPRSLRVLLEGSNYASVVIPGPHGSLFSTCCSKAIYTASGQLRRGPGLSVSLSQTADGARLLDGTTESEITTRLQPWLLSHRLKNLRAVRQCQLAGGSLPYPPSEIVRTFQLCTQSGSENEKQWMSLVAASERDRRAQQYWDETVATTEILMPLSHRSPSPMSLKALLADVNTFLATRNAGRQCTSEELGYILKDMGIERDRKGPGMYIIFDEDVIRRIHESARKHGIGEAVTGCSHCVATGLGNSPTMSGLDAM